MKKEVMCFAFAVLAAFSWGDTITNTVVIVSNYYNNVYHESVVTQKVKNTHVEYYFTNNVYTVSNRTIVVSQTNLNVNVINTNFGPWIAKCEAAAVGASNALNSATSAASASASSASAAGSSASASAASAATASAAADRVERMADRAVSNINERVQWFDDHSGGMVTNVNLNVNGPGYVTKTYGRFSVSDGWKYKYRCVNGSTEIYVTVFGKTKGDTSSTIMWYGNAYTGSMPSGYYTVYGILTKSTHELELYGYGGATELSFGTWYIDDISDPDNIFPSKDSEVKNNGRSYFVEKVPNAPYITGDLMVYNGQDQAVGELAKKSDISLDGDFKFPNGTDNSNMKIDHSGLTLNGLGGTNLNFRCYVKNTSYGYAASSAGYDCIWFTDNQGYLAISISNRRHAMFSGGGSDNWFTIDEARYTFNGRWDITVTLSHTGSRETRTFTFYDYTFPSVVIGDQYITYQQRQYKYIGIMTGGFEVYFTTVIGTQTKDVIDTTLFSGQLQGAMRDLKAMISGNRTSRIYDFPNGRFIGSDLGIYEYHYDTTTDPDDPAMSFIRDDGRIYTRADKVYNGSTAYYIYVCSAVPDSEKVNYEGGIYKGGLKIRKMSGSQNWYVEVWNDEGTQYSYTQNVILMWPRMTVQGHVYEAYDYPIIYAKGNKVGQVSTIENMTSLSNWVESVFQKK